MIPPPPRSTLFPYTTLFRSLIPCRPAHLEQVLEVCPKVAKPHERAVMAVGAGVRTFTRPAARGIVPNGLEERADWSWSAFCPDRKSTRLNSSHGYISYAVFC